MKKQLLFSLLLGMISFMCARMHVMHPFLLIIKYTTLTAAFVIFAYAIFHTHIKKEIAWLYWTGVLILTMYGILTIDTFYVHAIKGLFGIIRYPMYSLYGLPYIIFMIPGILLCFKKKTG